MTPERTCKNCESILIGRSDKTYCNDLCKSRYNNRLKKEKINSPSGNMTEKNILSWLEEHLLQHIEKHGSISKKMLTIHINKAKLMYNTELEFNTHRWVKNREQTREVALRIGFQKGFDDALMCYEDFYEKLSKTIWDEDEFTTLYMIERMKELNLTN